MKLTDLLPMSPQSGPPLPRALGLRWPIRGTEELGERDMLIGGIIGEGAIPLHGRENRREPCHGCRIDPGKPFEAGNAMVTTKGSIGMLNQQEVRDWCSELVEEKDGRCTRAAAIREAAKECKAQYPTDSRKYFECFVPKFAASTRGR